MARAARAALELGVGETAANLDCGRTNGTECVARGDDNDRTQAASLCGAKLRDKAISAGKRRGPAGAIRSLGLAAVSRHRFSPEPTDFAR